MIFVTGDTHGDFSRFGSKRFPQAKATTREDAVIICGDFGGRYFRGKKLARLAGGKAVYDPFCRWKPRKF